LKRKLKHASIVGSLCSGRSDHAIKTIQASIPQGNFTSLHFTDWRPIAEARCKLRDDLLFTGASTPPQVPQVPHVPLIVFGMKFKQSRVPYSRMLCRPRLLESAQRILASFTCSLGRPEPRHVSKSTSQSLMLYR
jgi:hypothetical protein